MPKGLVCNICIVEVVCEGDLLMPNLASLLVSPLPSIHECVHLFGRVKGGGLCVAIVVGSWLV